MRIAVDSEFSFNADNDFYPVCACFTLDDGSVAQFWRTEMDACREFILNHKSDTYVAHNIETAEGYLWQYLGLRPTHYKWHDTLQESRIVWNFCTTKEHYRHDLASCLDREGVCILDKEAKHADQSICIWKQDCTWAEHLARMDANKEHLLAYCLSDTAHLLELDAKLILKLIRDLPMSRFNHLDKDEVLDPVRRPAYFGFISAMYSEVSWHGIPLDATRVATLMRNAPKAIARLQNEFVLKYPGSFRKDKNKLTKNVERCRQYAAEVYGSNPPLTDSGKVSLASEFTKPHKDMDDFLGHYYRLDEQCRALASFAKPNREKNWLGMYIANKGIIRPRSNPLGAATGRCGSKPSSGFVYTMGKAFRGLINPPEGKVLIELDYHSEEIGIQAYLSGDARMAKMYEGPDYYTAIAHSIDPTITSKSDPRRAHYKTISLMSNYGAGPQHMADIAKVPLARATKILNNLKRMFRKYWAYVETVVNHCDARKALWFSDGFRIYKQNDGKSTTLMNFPFQGTGAYILRQMMIELFKAKITVVATVHDAIVIESDESTWSETAARATQIMKDVSKRALGVAIDVGSPEVTYHDIINCHSELQTREQYDTEPHNKYHEQFMQYMTEIDQIDVGDSENLYVDEVIEKK